MQMLHFVNTSETGVQWEFVFTKQRQWKLHEVKYNDGMINLAFHVLFSGGEKYLLVFPPYLCFGNFNSETHEEKTAIFDSPFGSVSEWNWQGCKQFLLPLIYRLASRDPHGQVKGMPIYILPATGV